MGKISFCLCQKKITHKPTLAKLITISYHSNQTNVQEQTNILAKKNIKNRKKKKKEGNLELQKDWKIPEMCEQGAAIHGASPLPKLNQRNAVNQKHLPNKKNQNKKKKAS